MPGQGHSMSARKECRTQTRLCARTRRVGSRTGAVAWGTPGLQSPGKLGEQPARSPHLLKGSLLLILTPAASPDRTAQPEAWQKAPKNPTTG